MILSTQLKIALVLTMLAVTLAIPETIFGLVHSIAIGLFEILEGALDEIIEHLFHTSRHTTQVIVFYIMWGMFLFGLYRLFQYLKSLYIDVKSEFPYWFKQKYEQASTNWQAMPFGKKFKMITGCSLGAACFAVLVF